MSQHFVIGLTNTDGCHVTYHYGRNLRHVAQGERNERVTYWVINGGWTATVYKDGRFLCNGSPIKGGPVVVLHFAYEDPGQDYNTVIYKHQRRLGLPE